jgi:hypothetical protein
MNSCWATYNASHYLSRSGQYSVNSCTKIRVDHMFIDAKAIIEDEMNKLKKIKQHNPHTKSSVVAWYTNLMQQQYLCTNI